MHAAGEGCERKGDLLSYLFTVVLFFNQKTIKSKITHNEEWPLLECYNILELDS